MKIILTFWAMAFSTSVHAVTLDCPAVARITLHKQTAAIIFAPRMGLPNDSATLISDNFFSSYYRSQKNGLIDIPGKIIRGEGTGSVIFHQSEKNAWQAVCTLGSKCYRGPNCYGPIIRYNITAETCTNQGGESLDDYTSCIDLN